MYLLSVVVEVHTWTKFGGKVEISLLTTVQKALDKMILNKELLGNSKNIECPNIELSKHHILAQNRTWNMSNITKKRTVREHQTVCSNTSLVT